MFAIVILSTIGAMFKVRFAESWVCALVSLYAHMWIYGYGYDGPKGMSHRGTQAQTINTHGKMQKLTCANRDAAM